MTFIANYLLGQHFFFNTEPFIYTTIPCYESQYRERFRNDFIFVFWSLKPIDSASVSTLKAVKAFLNNIFVIKDVLEDVDKTLRFWCVADD